jgi:type II secretory pathway component PulF
MKIFNIITSVILAILILCIVYLIPEFESIQVDPMGDGQSGIGKGVIGLMILGLGILSLIFALIFILLMVIRTTNRNKWSYINLLASFLISAFTFLYFFG